MFGSRLAKGSRPSLLWTCSDPFVWRCAIMQLNLSTFRDRKRSITPLQGFSSLYLLRWSGHIRILVLTRRRITSTGNIISEKHSIYLSYSRYIFHTVDARPFSDIIFMILKSGLCVLKIVLLLKRKRKHFD